MVFEYAGKGETVSDLAKRVNALREKQEAETPALLERSEALIKASQQTRKQAQQQLSPPSPIKQCENIAAQQCASVPAGEQRQKCYMQLFTSCVRKIVHPNASQNNDNDQRLSSPFYQPK